VKKYIIAFFAAVAMLASVPGAQASDVGFSLGVNLGNVVARFYAPPVSTPPRVAFREPPEFVAQPGLGFYFAVGTPYDLFYTANRYYLCRGNAWFAAPYYNGPWVQIGYGGLPWALRRYPVARLRYFRDKGCRHYRDYGYGYGHFRPERRGWDRHARWDSGLPGGMGHHGHGMHWGNDED
jgi:hypothetical protein